MPETETSRDQMYGTFSKTDTGLDWLKTPEPSNEYGMTMYEDGGLIQNIDLTREEYIALKQRLAELRAPRTEQANG